MHFRRAQTRGSWRGRLLLFRTVELVEPAVLAHHLRFSLAQNLVRAHNDRLGAGRALRQEFAARRVLLLVLDLHDAVQPNCVLPRASLLQFDE